MYYTSYKNKNSKSSSFKILIIIISFILLILIGYLFFSQEIKKILDKEISRSYIDKLIEHKEYDKALNIILRYISKGENLNWWYFYKAGIIYYYESDYLNSLLFFRTANVYDNIEKIPVDINFYIGDNYYKLGKSYYPYSIKYFEKYYKVINSSKSLISEEDFLYKLAIMYVETEDYEKASKVIQKIYQKFENDYRLLYYYSIVLKNLNKLKEAIQILNKIIENTSDLDIRKDSLFLLGKIYVDLEDYKKAIEYFLQCVDISPNSDISYYYLGYCYSQLHDIKIAINYLTRALLINNNNQLAKNLLKALR
ncbi:MAG: tetratricopeptide repeat protein [Exilispira sp.]